MARSASLKTKINTQVTQPGSGAAARPAAAGKGKPQAGKRGQGCLDGDARESVRSGGRTVIEIDHRITVYPPAEEGEPWRAVFTENGQRRYRQAASEPALAEKLAKVKERLVVEAVNMERPGAALIAYYLSPGRHRPGRHRPDRRWSRRHADTQRRLCERFVAPVIAEVTCQDIKVAHMQGAVNAAPTAGEGERLHRCLRAMVNAGLSGGFLTNWRLGEVYWQAGDRAEPEPAAQVQGETVLWADPAEIPSDADVAKLGQALGLGRRGDLDELMAYTAAYSGLRQGELFALTAVQLAPATIDGLVYACSVVMLYAARHPQVTAPPLARWLLALGIAATLAANIAVGWSHGPVGAVVAAWPAASLVGSYELLVWIIRTSAAVSPDSNLTADHPELAADRAGPPERAAAGPRDEAGGTAAGAGPGAWSGRTAAVPADQHSGPAEDQADQAAGPVGSYPGKDVNAAAADAYQDSVLAGRPLSER